jgi:hypothetical protein
MIPDRGRDFSLCHHIQAGSRASLVFYPMSIMGKAAGV